MASIRAPEDITPKNRTDGKPESGVALFMVIASMSILSVLVTEFTYIASMNQTVAFDGLDQLKAHYLAKSGLKLSLLRLKAFQQVKGALSALGGGGSGANGAGAVPKQVLDKIWSFPFFYPVPADLPGLTLTQKESIEKFEKASGLEGSFSAVIDSESSKFNLNSIFQQFSAPAPSPSPGASPTPQPAQGTTAGQNPTPSPSASTSPFNVDDARTSLHDYFAQILSNKIENDPDFAEEYRDFKLDDFMDNLFAWTDRTYERKTAAPSESMTFKGAPFNSINELRMIPGMDDKLFDLFSAALTASTTPGININTMREPTLKALVPGIKDEEVDDFFKYRDDDTQDNTFKNPDDFFNYLSAHVESMGKGSAGVDKLKDDLNKRGVRLVTDETEFKITVKAKVNQSTRLIEAWVTLSDTPGKSSPSTTGTNGQQPAPLPGTPTTTGTANGTQPRPDPGLRITFMRIL